MATLPSNFSALQDTLIAQVQTQLGQVVPLLERAGEEYPTAPGTRQLKLVHRSRIGQMADLDTGAYPATAGYKSVEPGEGPSFTASATARAIHVPIRLSDEYHHDQFNRVSADIAQAVANDINVVAIERLEAANSYSVSYTTDGGAQTAFLFALSGAPWYTKSGTAQSNIISANLTANTLELARTRMRTWLNWFDDTPTRPNMGALLLLVPPALETLARTITGAPTFPLSAVSFAGGSAVTGDVENVMAQYGIVPVVSEDLASTTASFLINPALQPMAWGMVTPPQIVVERRAAPQQDIVSVTYELIAEMKPYEGGAIRMAA